MNRSRDLHGIATVPPSVTNPRVLLFGLRCGFTETVIEHLLAHNIDIAGVVVPGHPALQEPLRLDPPRRQLPIAGSQQHSTTSPSTSLTVYQIGSIHGEGTYRLITSVQPDVILVACFPRRIPDRIARLATMAALNIHPSALPQNRGPDPLFWAFRRGDGRFGVTVHALSPTLDAGDIVDSREFSGWHGISELDAERSLAAAGADMAVDAISRRATQDAILTPQDEARASYESWPTDRDFRIDTARSAQSAFNFIRGVRDRGIPISASVCGREHQIIDAIAIEHDGCSLPAFASTTVVSIPCNPGLLIAEVEDDQG
jgi:methionyl-tRNA formyltransferase